MRFGYSNSIRGRVVECTPELLSQALDNPATARVCAEIEDALEKVRRGEMSRDDFEALKAQNKKQLPILTPHAMFKSGRRLNSDAEASGLSMYDIDHISDPRGFYEQRIAGREKELGIVMAHVTPSTEGLRLLFIVPQGLTLEEAQQWMSKQLDDDHYDGCVKDLARCSFLVPRSYVVYLDSSVLFRSEGVKECRSEDNSILRSSGVQECRSSDVCLASKSVPPFSKGRLGGDCESFNAPRSTLNVKCPSPSVSPFPRGSIVCLTSNPSSPNPHPSSNLKSEAVHPTPPPSEGPGEAPPSSQNPHPSSNSPSFGGVRGGFNPPLQGEGWGEALPLLRRGQGRP